MQEEAIEVESNLLASEKLKSRFEKGKQKVESKPSPSYNRNQKLSLEEMAKRMEEMSSELSWIKLEKQRWNAPREGGNRNPNYYGRNNVPQIMQREKK